MAIGRQWVHSIEMASCKRGHFFIDSRCVFGFTLYVGAILPTAYCLL